jgi:hypothetical protein
VDGEGEEIRDQVPVQVSVEVLKGKKKKVGSRRAWVVCIIPVIFPHVFFYRDNALTPKLFEMINSQIEGEE